MSQSEERNPSGKEVTIIGHDAEDSANFGWSDTPLKVTIEGDENDFQWIHWSQLEGYALFDDPLYRDIKIGAKHKLKKHYKRQGSVMWRPVDVPADLTLMY